jgi:preprotein translocase subunit SecB
MPPLMVDPIDFAALYQAKLQSGGIKGPSVGTA